MNAHVLFVDDDPSFLDELRRALYAHHPEWCDEVRLNCQSGAPRNECNGGVGIGAEEGFIP